ncbi:MAG: 30S ribosomal protein S17 [bacterium]|nr:30S ribosomal protein S17 [bacterium]
MESAKQKSTGRVLIGTVVSTKMKDTIVVLVSRFVKHPKYRKYMRYTKRLKVHDAGNTKQMGEKVEIVECRPLSKDKHFRIV